MPLVAQWVGRIPPGTASPLWAATVDLLPTFLAAAGLPRPASMRLDGYSLLPALLDDEEVLPELAYKNGIVRAVKPPADLPRADYFKYARLARVPMKPAKAMNDMLHATACKM